MPKSPEAIRIREKDKTYRDSEHSKTVQAEADRRSREPVNGKQPNPPR